MFKLIGCVFKNYRYKSCISKTIMNNEDNVNFLQYIRFVVLDNQPSEFSINQSASNFFLFQFGWLVVLYYGVSTFF